MFQAAAAFGAGVLAQSSVQATCAQAPTCTAAPPEGSTAFKVSVRVLAASVPALAEPGRMLKFKMRLAASLAGVEKETEDADFAGPASKSSYFTVRDDAGTPSSPGDSRHSTERSSSHRFGGGAASNRVSSSGSEWAAWRFGDTLTFAARACDLLDGGMRLRLRVQSEACLGPVQVQMPHSSQDLGDAVVDLRQRVFPVASSSWSPPPYLNGIECEFEHQPTWETPAIVFPLSHVSDSPISGVEVSIPAKVALSFSLNVDPEVLMREVDQASKPLPYKVVDQVVSTILAPLALCGAAQDRHGETLAWASCSVDASDGAVTPPPRERRQPQALPVLPRVPAACSGGLRKV